MKFKPTVLLAAFVVTIGLLLVGTGTAQAQNVPPTADVGGPYNNVEAGTPVTFDGSGSNDPDGEIVSYSWDFGDFTAGSGVRPSHTYGATGNYFVTLTVTDNDEDIDVDQIQIKVEQAGSSNEPPVADPNGPYTGVVDEPVAFDGSGSNDPDGTIESYEWNFGDFTTPPDNRFEETPSHTYTSAGTYIVNLTVIDDIGASNTVQTQATIAEAPVGPVNEPPVADPGGLYDGTVGEAVTFDGSGSNDPDGEIVRYSWNFGDGQTGVGATVEHTYSEAKIYTVSLTVEDDLGATGFDSTTAVIIREPFVGDVSKVAAEGEPLLDGTVLKQILLAGGVGINASGKVAFGGRASTDNVPGVFTQDGPVVKEGYTLPDGTIVNDLSPSGGVAISVSRSGDRVAFHGETGTGQTDTDTDAVFTQDGLVVLEGDPLPDGETVHNIKPEGKVAINEIGQIAFHGKIKIEGDDLDIEELRAVFTQDGLLVKVGDPLPDGTIVGYIDETGGVAINLFGDVAFHGVNVELNDTPAAVFTQNGLVAKVGMTLPDGSIIAGIDETGGVAISLFGDVAFHGYLQIPDPPGAVKAVFTQYGLVAKEGGTLLDGTIVKEITPSGGVGISFDTDVVFHGKAGPTDAVFTQAGLVAAEGMTLPDGETLLNIKPEGKVAINLFGEVAFHGQAGTTDAVFVGLAPLPPAP